VAARSEGDGERSEDLYVKRRPVPFGEYVPGRRWLSWIPALDQVPRDAVAGPGPQAFTVAPGVTVAVVICFETLFSDLVRSNVLAGDDAGLSSRSRTMRRSSAPPNRISISHRAGCARSRPADGSCMRRCPARPRSSTRRAGPRRDGLFTQTTIRRDVPLATGRTPFLIVGDVVGVIGASVLVLLLLLPVLTGAVRRTRTLRR
jgi:apolipoprotein N-acyltransferase